MYEELSGSWVTDARSACLTGECLYPPAGIIAMISKRGMIRLVKMQGDFIIKKDFGNLLYDASSSKRSVDYHRDLNRRFKKILAFSSAMMFIGLIIVFARALQQFYSKSEYSLNLILGIICVLYLIFIYSFVSGHTTIDSMSQKNNIRIYERMLVLPSSRVKALLFFEVACVPMELIDGVYKTINGYLIEFKENRYEPYYLNSRRVFQPENFKDAWARLDRWSTEPRSIEKLRSYEKKDIIDADETIFLSGNEWKSLSDVR